MAKCEIQMPAELLSRISKLGRETDRICEKVLEAGGRVALKQVKSNLNCVLSGKSTGELARSIGLSPVKVDRNGNYDIKVGFSEPRSDGDSNAKIANILEYGKHGQRPRPFLKPARSQCKVAAQEAMIRTFEEEVSKL